MLLFSECCHLSFNDEVQWSLVYSVVYFIFHFVLVFFLPRCEFSLFFVLLQSLICCVLLTNVSSKVSLFISMCLLSNMHMFECWTSKYMCVVCAFLPKHWASCGHLMFFQLCCLESPSKLWMGTNLERCQKLNALHYIKWTQFWLLTLCNLSFYFESFVLCSCSLCDGWRTWGFHFFHHG
jgi:hypothetical protein